MASKLNLSVYDKSRSEWEHLIDEWVFSERDRAIIKRHYLDAITIMRVAEEFDISDSQVKRILKKAETLLTKI